MKKIGIVTSARELNYGAILQAYALQIKIAEFGYDTCLLWWRNQKKTNHDIRIRKLLGMVFKYVRYPQIVKQSFQIYGNSFGKVISERSKSLYQIFEAKYLNINFLTYSQMRRYAYSSECIAIVAGSDQIWNSCAVYVDPFYYLRFAPAYKRIAYAPSLGKSYIPDYNKKIMKKFINDFLVISVRENSGKKLLEKLVKKHITVVLDPSLLLKAKDWEKIEGNVILPDKYLLLYFLDEPNIHCFEQLNRIIEESGLPVLALPYRFPLFDRISNINYIDAGPSEFLTLIHNAEVVLTDSFHGTVFSINFNKNFYTFNRQYGSNQSQASRIVDLLNLLGLPEHFIKSEGCIKWDAYIDYNKTNKKLEILREKSEKYLIKAVSNCAGGN